MARTRTFIAIDIGDEIRERAAALQAVLNGCGASVNWVEPANLHVTLLFLGDLDDLELVRVCRAAATATTREPPFTLSVTGIGAFPTLRRPKTLWTGIDKGQAELRRLHAAIEAPLMAAGTYRREERAYTPHLTLGRVKDEAEGNVIAPELAKHAEWRGGFTPVTELLVMASDFRTGRNRGPEYTVVGRGPLLG